MTNHADAFHRSLSGVDPEAARILEGDLCRQRDNAVLIPSENYASPSVLAAQGSVMTNKYAEGYPGSRYYNGCEWMDGIESLVIERTKALFNAEHVNAQTHSGSQANIAAFQALLEPGDRILSMRLSHGGHLSHGLAQNIAGKLYDVAFYGVDAETGRIDLNKVEELAESHQPRMIIVGGSAYPRLIDFAPWREIADSVGAYLLADIAHIAGLIAGGVHPSPFGYADVVTTTTHKTLRGPRGALVMCRADLASDIDRAVFPGLQGGPFMHAMAARAVNLKEAMEPSFKEYAAQIVKNAAALADGLLSAGFDLVSGGTDNHLMLVDLRKRPFSGKRAADRLEEAGIIVNRNTVPNDPRFAVCDKRFAPWQPRLDDARHARSGDAPDCRLDKRGGKEGDGRKGTR